MICITTALALLHIRNLALGFSYSEPDQFGASSCHPRDSCLPFRSEDEDHLWGNYTCECGPHCVRHGTCCGDSPHAGTTSPHVERHLGEKCRRLAPYFTEYFASVSRCSDRWRHESLARDACEGRDASSTEDPLSAMPVTSGATGVTYKNRFCARCNFEDDPDFRMWDAVLIHEAKGDSDFLNATRDYVLDNLLYDRERRSWGVSTAGHSFLKLRLLFRVPPVLRKVVKRCHPALVSDCDASRAFDYGLRYRCLSYYSPVTMRSNGGKRAVKRYRNVHCAICNGVTGAEDFACGADVQKRKKPTFSFAHLIDISGDFADRGADRCGANQVWDPFSKKCRSLACALPGHVIKDGRCVKS